MEENNNENRATNTNFVIEWIEKLSSVIQKIGLQNLILTIMVMFLVVVVGQFVFNPSSLVDKIEEIQRNNHTEAVMKRIKAEPKIREYLTEFRGELNADRVFILETHNGGNNLANLPFLYIDLTYAEPKSSLDWLESEYKNVRLSRYPWSTKVYEETMWTGYVTDIEPIDPELYYRLKGEDVYYIGVIMMFGTYNPSGVLGVVYTNSDIIPSTQEIKKQLTKYSSMIAALLNNEK